jgi:hypothetical protein
MNHVLSIERHQQMRTAIQDLLAHSGSPGIQVAADSLDGIHQAIVR